MQDAWAIAGFALCIELQVPQVMLGFFLAHLVYCVCLIRMHEHRRSFVALCYINLFLWLLDFMRSH